jgi:hypothetical protein
VEEARIPPASSKEAHETVKVKALRNRKEKESVMNRINYYSPEGLEWEARGNKCRVRDLNRMCRNILANGTVTDVHRHTSQSQDPDGKRDVWHSGTMALTVESVHIPGLVYCIHIHGLRVVEIIETMTFGGPNEKAGE